tara:strand:+ start:13834 stop:14388 length:555 start_codon:yes stop_codon:yes gene_type:complete
MNPIIKLLTFVGKMGKDWAKMSPEHKKNLLALYGLTGSGIAALAKFKSADSEYIGEKSQVADEIDPSIEKGLYNPFQQKGSFPKDVPLMGPVFSQLQKEVEELEKPKLTGKIDPVTGSKYNELDFIPERSDWAKENIDGLKKDPKTGEWFKPTGPASGEELIKRFLEELEALKTLGGFNNYDKK